MRTCVYYNRVLDEILIYKRGADIAITSRTSDYGRCTILPIADDDDLIFIGYL